MRNLVFVYLDHITQVHVIGLHMRQGLGFLANKQILLFPLDFFLSLHSFLERSSHKCKQVPLSYVHNVFLLHLDSFWCFAQSRRVPFFGRQYFNFFFPYEQALYLRHFFLLKPSQIIMGVGASVGFFSGARLGVFVSNFDGEFVGGLVDGFVGNLVGESVWANGDKVGASVVVLVGVEVIL